MRKWELLECGMRNVERRNYLNAELGMWNSELIEVGIRSAELLRIGQLLAKVGYTLCKIDLRLSY